MKELPSKSALPDPGAPPKMDPDEETPEFNRLCPLLDESAVKSPDSNCQYATVPPNAVVCEKTMQHPNISTQNSRVLIRMLALSSVYAGFGSPFVSHASEHRRI